MIFSPNQSTNLAGENERFEGDIPSMNDDPLAIDLGEAEVVTIISGRDDKSVAYWNEELKLDEVRKRNEEYWLNTYTPEDLYDYQSEYRNNRIFTAVETLLSIVMSQKAEPTVIEGEDSDSARQLAKDLEGSLLAIYEDDYLKQKGTLIARHLLIGLRLGVAKLVFDPDSGYKQQDGTRTGAITVKVIRPQRIVLGKDVTDPDHIPYISEYCTGTIEKLVNLFPEKKEEIFKKFGIVRGVRSQLAREVGYVETWFDYRDKSGDMQNGTAWTVDKLYLGAKKNLNYNYDEWGTDSQGKPIRLNFFDRPKPPYILFNHLNLGKYVIDSTSLSEQSQKMQDILNIRGRQIVDNADQAQGGLVFNSKQISAEAAAKIVGDPGEKIMVKGDVRTAAARLPRNSLEAFVLRDKQDARAEIDNIFGANAATRGETTDSKTLGQDIMSQRANMGRIQVVADAMEDGFDRMYKYIVQMMKVYFDQDIEFSYSGPEGNAQFGSINKNKIHPNCKVRVKAGSMIPKDKFAIRNETIQSLAILDPLSIAEGLDKPNPKEFAKRLVYYRFDMNKYLSEILQVNESGQDQNAMADIQSIIQTKQMPNIPEDPSQAYLATLQGFIQGTGFKTIPPDIQQLLIQFSENVMNAAKNKIGTAPTQTPAEQPPAPGTPPTPEAAPTPGPEGTPPPGFLRGIINRISGRK